MRSFWKCVLALSLIFSIPTSVSANSYLGSNKYRLFTNLPTQTQLMLVWSIEFNDIENRCIVGVQQEMDSAKIFLKDPVWTLIDLDGSISHVSEHSWLIATVRKCVQVEIPKDPVFKVMSR